MKSEADARGMFGPFGGRFVPEMLVAALDELIEASGRILADPEYRAELVAVRDAMRAALADVDAWIEEADACRG